MAVGTDLSTLGLDLGMAGPLYPTFASPWVEGPRQADPLFSLPQCYNLRNPPNITPSHFAKLKTESLFYIFYAMPNDTFQAYATQELYKREWQFHEEHKLWFRRANPGELSAQATGSEQIFFDINVWEQRLFNGNAQANLGGLLSEDEIGLKQLPPHAPPSHQQSQPQQQQFGGQVHHPQPPK